jgi:hypothetical protein
MKFSWVVPYRSDGDPHKERVWDYVRARGLTEIIPDAELIVGDDGSEIFSHAGSFNEGVSRATGDILVLTDADTTVKWIDLACALDDVINGAVWRMMERYSKVNETATLAMLDEDPRLEYDFEDRACEWRGRSWAGFLVIRRSDYLSIGGYDERVSGWGADDGIMGVTLSSCFGPEDRTPGDVIHLWHDNGYERDHGMSDEQWALVRAYEAATEPQIVWDLMKGKP